MIKLDLKGKNILLTGASQGIGSILRKLLEEFDVNLICTYNSNLINDNKVDIFHCDISKEEDIKELFKYVKSKYNHLDILINCAAISLDNDIYDTISIMY